MYMLNLGQMYVVNEYIYYELLVFLYSSSKENQDITSQTFTQVLETTFIYLVEFGSSNDRIASNERTSYFILFKKKP